MDEKKTGNLQKENEQSKEKKPIEEYLHCIDVDKVLQELGLDMNGLCDMLNIDYQTINRWSWTKQKKGNRPKYNAIIRMLQKGASVKTLFGIDYNERSPMGNNEFKEGMQLSQKPMTKDEVIALFKSMKERGEI